ncbi:MAG: sialate O-acetylesterase [bacterium]|nr:sialate O-acetylesterase [bacterium]
MVASDGALGHPFQPGFLHATAIAHVERMPIRGVIWYQGESNSTSVELHAELFGALVVDWRRRWGIGDFPFLFCQLSSISPEKGYRSELWPEFRDSQRRMLAELANTGMAVTSDVGHRTDVHPKEKRVVGERLARWALADVYGKDLVRSGPLFASLVCDGERARVRFEHGTGLRAASGELIGFEVRAAEGAFVPATARLEGDEVVVTSPAVHAPAAVRYGWTPYSEGNLVNAAGLPASTFTSE